MGKQRRSVKDVVVCLEKRWIRLIIHDVAAEFLPDLNPVEYEVYRMCFSDASTLMSPIRSSVWLVQGDPQNWHHSLYASTLSCINRFSELFHCKKWEKICNNISLKIQPHLKCVATLPCEISSDCRSISLIASSLIGVVGLSATPSCRRPAARWTH